MSRELIKKKYGRSLEQPAALVTDAKLSPAVLKLRTFIQENKHHGIQLVIKDGRPALRFVPGLNKGNAERWDACLAAEVLIFDAADDLMKLIKQGNAELEKKATGPSSDPEPHGSAHLALSLLLDF